MTYLEELRIIHIVMFAVACIIAGCYFWFVSNTFKKQEKEREKEKAGNEIQHRSYDNPWED